MLEVLPDPSLIFFFSSLIYFLITAMKVMNIFMSRWYIHSVTYICHCCFCASHFCGGVGDENKTVFGTINVSSMDVAYVKLKIALNAPYVLAQLNQVFYISAI